MSHFVQEMGMKKDAFKLSIRLMAKWWFRTCSAGGGVKSVLSLYFNSVQNRTELKYRELFAIFGPPFLFLLGVKIAAIFCTSCLLFSF